MLAPRLWPEAVLTLYRTFGARGAYLRSVFELRRATNRFLRSPRHAVQAGVDLAFRVDGVRLRAQTNAVQAVERANRVIEGEYEAYRCRWQHLPSDSIMWLAHPKTGAVADSTAAWWHISLLDRDYGDIKDLWEPARFAWAYDLVRGFLVTGDHRFARAFHDRFAVWRASSPAFSGPHWSCGQETAIRAVALLYAEANLGSAASSTAKAMQSIAEVLAASGERIADAIGYAISQRNNHAISEAAGLVALGVRFRGGHPDAAVWLRKGRHLLERLIREQFADDGWYIQHSFTYLRLALDQCVVAERSLRSIGQSLSDPAVARLRAAADLLLSVVEPASGIVPNHGANDGAFVHPVTSAEYRDMRPILTAVTALWRHPLPSDVAPDTETLAWLGLDVPPAGPPVPHGIRTGPSGWVAARTAGAFAFLRAGTYGSRPGHLDSLHLDVRLDGREVIVDPGTYAYNAPPPWRNGLAEARVHNGPVLDDREPGVRGPRFLWYVWPSAKVVSAGDADGALVFEAELSGAARRLVRMTDEAVIVEDRILRDRIEQASVRWLLHPQADPRALSVQGSVVEVAQDGSTVSWFSPGYGVRLASRSVVVIWSPRNREVVRTVVSVPRTQR